MCQNPLKDEKHTFHSVQFLVLQPLTWHQQHFPQSEVWRSCPSLFPEERWEVSRRTLERLNSHMKLILAILNTYAENFSIFFHAKCESQLKTCVRIWLDRQSQVFWDDDEAIFEVLVNVFMITSKDCIIIIIIISITISTVWSLLWLYRWWLSADPLVRSAAARPPLGSPVHSPPTPPPGPLPAMHRVRKEGKTLTSVELLMI